jgi:hypothetical protein
VTDEEGVVTFEYKSQGNARNVEVVWDSNHDGNFDQFDESATTKIGGKFGKYVELQLDVVYDTEGNIIEDTMLFA